MRSLWLGSCVWVGDSLSSPIVKLDGLLAGFAVAGVAGVHKARTWAQLVGGLAHSLKFGFYSVVEVVLHTIHITNNKHILNNYIIVN